MFEWRGTRSCRSSRWGEAVKLSRYDFPIPKNDFRTKPVGFFNLENESVPPKRPGAQEDYLWKWQVERTMVLSTLAHPCICHLEGDWLKHQLQWLFGPFFGDLRQQFFLLCSYNTPKSSPTRPSWWLMWMFWLQSQSPGRKKIHRSTGWELWILVVPGHMKLHTPKIHRFSPGVQRLVDLFLVIPIQWSMLLAL